MKTISLENITQAVVNHGDQGKTHPHLHEIYASLVRHLHAFVREVNLTEEELQLGRDFLTRVGRPHQEMPNGEVHMMTDLLGISELVELLHDVDRGAVTETNLEGPLYVPDAPERKMGERIGVDEDGETLLMSGRVVDTAGRRIAKALVDVWQTNSKGFYDLQDPAQPKGNLRGRFTTGADGKYAFETVVPLGYNVPASGPCGEVLRLLGRHTWRPAHIHFKLSAPGYIPITTLVYVEGAPYLDSDTVFSVKTALIALRRHDTPEELRARNQPKPFDATEFDFVLRPAA